MRILQGPHRPRVLPMHGSFRTLGDPSIDPEYYIPHSGMPKQGSPIFDTDPQYLGFRFY